MKVIELRETQAAYATTIDELAKSDEPVIISREGKPFAVVMRYDVYQKLATPLKSSETPSVADETFERNRAAYLAMKPELLKTHRGTYVAFHNGKLVGSDVDEPTLLERVYAKYGYGALFVAPVEEQERVYWIRSPHLVKKND